MILNLSNKFKTQLFKRGITVSFLSLYKEEYGFIRHTALPDQYYNEYSGGVCLMDYPNIEFYEIPAYKRVVSTEHGVEQWMKSIDKHPELFVDDALNLKKILLQQGPIEHDRFVYHLCQILVNCYWYPKLTVDALLLFASNIMYSTQQPKKSNRKWVFNKEDDTIKKLLKERGPFKMIHDLDRCRKTKLINETYDSRLSEEDNMKVMREKGICKDKRTLIRYLDDSNIEHFNDNQLKENRVMELKKEGKSVREISRIMKVEGFEKVSKDSIARILNKINENFEEVNKQFGVVDENFEIVEERLDDLNDKIEHKFDVVNHRVNDHHEIINNHADVLEEHEDKIDRILKVLERQNKILKELSKNHKNIV